MNKVLNRIGIGISTLYIVGLYLLTNDRLSELQEMQLNELGDFLAGAFGPLAIFWLVLGFIQQGKELKQNTEALELQAKELQYSVSQQKELVDIAKRQHETELTSINDRKEKEIELSKPRFVFLGFGGNHREVHKFSCNILNSGAPVADVAFDFNVAVEELKPQKCPMWEKGDKVRIEFVFEDNKIPDRFSLRIRYVDTFGEKGEERRLIASTVGENSLPELYLEERRS